MTLDYVEEYKKDLGFNKEELISQVVLKACDYCQCPYETCVEVLLVDDETIRQMNRENRDIDASTDVLSFPNAFFESPGDFQGLTDDCFDPDSGEYIVGDIVISLDHVIAQALEYGHSTKRELAFLTAHSMLHLFGYDHMTKEEAEIMEQHQRNILEELGIGRD